MTVTAPARPERLWGLPATLRVAVALVAAVTVMVVGLAGLFASPASAHTLTRPGNAVGAFGVAGGQVVGAHPDILAGQRRARAPSYDPTASGSCVAAETEPAVGGQSNFMANGEKFADYASNAKPLEGYHDVIVHGSPSDFGATSDAWSNGANFSHRVLANLIEQDPGYGGGPIRLLACDTGGCGATAAQNLANKLGTEVMAPTSKVWAYPSGNLVVGPQPGVSTGGWTSFFPGTQP